MATKKVDAVEVLLGRPEGAEASIITKAKARFQQIQEQENIEKVMSQLRNIDEIVENNIYILRQTRKEEKRIKKKLTAILEAKTRFEADGDYSVFYKTYKSLYTPLREYKIDI